MVFPFRLYGIIYLFIDSIFQLYTKEGHSWTIQEKNPKVL